MNIDKNSLEILIEITMISRIPCLELLCGEIRHISSSTHEAPSERNRKIPLISIQLQNDIK